MVRRDVILQPMKIAYVYDAVYPYVMGGVEKRIREVSTRLAARGHEVHLYGMTFWDGPDTIEEDGVVLHGVCAPLPFYAGGRRSVAQALRFGQAVLGPLRASGADLIDCQNFPYFSCISARAAASAGKVPLVITWHEVWGEYWQEYLGRKGVAGRAVERFVATLPDRHIAVSPSTASALAGLGVREGVEVVPNGIDLARIAAVPPAAESTDVIFVGRLIREKHADLLVEALARVREEVPDLRAVIVGDGPERASVERRVHDLGLGGSVFFTGFLPDDTSVIAAMKASKVFVLPSTREGFGIAALEAMACGLPVVTADHPGNAVRDLVEEGVNGFVCGLSAEEIAARVLFILQGWVDLKKSSQNEAGRYAWDAIVCHLESLYKNI
ncbi:glycosyltransferase family 4 protein [Methanofollis ethanolicus]|uniref:glycosyltransferase family 4 protein n=1 Tax=Methanofollis ethanolicus TaxID=488124 RepID=UPI000A5818B3|nr:glycosyltransferase family 4 protein [Methanofollis ethanolicus]